MGVEKGGGCSPIDSRTDQGEEATHAKSLLVGGTRGGWRDGKSEVRVSGSWNRQGVQKLEARH